MAEVKVDGTEHLVEEVVDEGGFATFVVEVAKMGDDMCLCGGDFDGENRLKHLVNEIGRSSGGDALGSAVFVDVFACKVNDDDHADGWHDGDKGDEGINFGHVGNGKASKDKVAPHVDVAVEVLNDAHDVVTKSVGDFARDCGDLAWIADFENGSHEVFAQETFD